MPESSARSVLLVAHGSQDARAAACVRALARTVAAVRPGLDVRVAFLEHCPPSPAEALRAMSPGTVVVPLLLTNAYHRSIDLPAQVADFDCVITETLGAVQSPAAPGFRDAPTTHPLLTALSKRLPPIDFDGLVLAAAGTRMAHARAGIESVAAALSELHGVPCRVAYASGAPPTGAAAVEALHAIGARRVVVASYFLAPGRLHDLVTQSALAAGALAAAPPLGASWPLANLILARVGDSLLAAA